MRLLDAGGSGAVQRRGGDRLGGAQHVRGEVLDLFEHGRERLRRIGEVVRAGGERHAGTVGRCREGTGQRHARVARGLGRASDGPCPCAQHDRRVGGVQDRAPFGHFGKESGHFGAVGFDERRVESGDGRGPRRVRVRDVAGRIEVPVLPGQPAEVGDGVHTRLYNVHRAVREDRGVGPRLEPEAVRRLRHRPHHGRIETDVELERRRPGTRSSENRAIRVGVRGREQLPGGLSRPVADGRSGDTPVVGHEVRSRHEGGVVDLRPDDAPQSEVPLDAGQETGVAVHVPEGRDTAVEHPPQLAFDALPPPVLVEPRQMDVGVDEPRNHVVPIEIHHRGLRRQGLRAHLEQPPDAIPFDQHHHPGPRLPARPVDHRDVAERDRPVRGLLRAERPQGH